MSHPTHQQYESLRATATIRPLPRWGIALIALVLGPLAFLLRGARQEMWDGGDHLLLVDNNSYSERYRRVRYQDVEVLQSWTTRDYVAPLILLGLGGLGYLAFAIWRFAELGTDSLAVGPAVVFGACLLFAAGLHAARGPTTRVRLRTRVQTLDLPALGRRRVADRVLPLLRERIMAAQDVEPPADPPPPA